MKGCGAHREERRGEESPTTPPLRCSRWVVVTWDKLKARTSRATRRNRYKKAHVPICTSDVCVCVCLSFGPLFSSSSSSSSSSSFFLISFLKRYKIPDLNICWFARCCLSFDLARDIIKFRPSDRPTDRPLMVQAGAHFLHSYSFNNKYKRGKLRAKSLPTLLLTKVKTLFLLGLLGLKLLLLEMVRAAGEPCRSLSNHFTAHPFTSRPSSTIRHWREARGEISRRPTDHIGHWPTVVLLRFIS